MTREEAPPLIGQTLSHYRLVEKLGGGGMGAVYKAEDLRLGRFVALKFLAPHLAESEGRRRFLHEAKAASALDHPNICTLYEIDESADGQLFLAMAFCEGESLARRIERGPLKLEEALDFASQIAAGLAHAHARGIVHRDVKPANLMVTPAGQIKIVDFGLAMLAGQSRLTRIGKAIGTLAYMSPEQFSAQPVDHRTDVWALGVVLHEMIAGRPPFGGESEQALAFTILQHSPLPLTALRTGVPLELDRIVAKALAKLPADRYQHVDEIPVDLRAVSRSRSQSFSSPFSAQETTVLEIPIQPAGSLPASSAAHPGPSPSPPRRRWSSPILLAALALVLIALGFLAGRALGPHAASTASPSFKLLTFRRGTIRSARFAPDGQTLVYGAAWDGAPIQLFLTRPESSQSTAIGLPPAEILSISRAGEMAVSLGHRFEGALMGRGTLARVPLLGGAPRQILEGVREADWLPNGSGLAAVRRVGDLERLELPLGHVLYQTAGYISHVRVSHDGQRIAFLDHPVYSDDRGAVAVVDLAGRKTVLSQTWLAVRGLSWSPTGKEVWFTAGHSGEGLSLYAVDLGGHERSLLRAPGSVILLDVAADGRALLAREDQVRQITALPPGEPAERDLSWLDFSVARALSDDGRSVLITHFGEGSGVNYSVYLRGTDGSPGIRLGEGEASALSPDGRWAASLIYGPPSRIVLLPTGAGEARSLRADGLTLSKALWFPDGKHLLVVGQEPGHGRRAYLMDLERGARRPITPDGIGGNSFPISPDGSLLAAMGPDGRITLYPVGGGPPREIPGAVAGEVPLRWTTDGESLFTARLSDLPLKVFRVELRTGRRESWKEIDPADHAGLIFGLGVHLAADGRAYVYNSQRLLSQLYLVQGLK